MNRHREIGDPDVDFLTGVASTLEAEFRESLSDWEGSPFAWLKTCTPARRGAMGKRLISSLLEERGFEVRLCPGRGADRLVNGRRVAIKFSMIWEENNYIFQQIRDQQYDILICLGVSPFDAHSWVFSKEFLLEGWGNLEGFTSQHGGQAGTDTAWIHIDPAAPHPWLSPHGGTLHDSINALTHLLLE